MTWEIYAYRLKGDTRIHYVGQSKKGAAARFAQMKANARAARSGTRKNHEVYATAAIERVGGWVLDNEALVEVIVLHSADTREDARRIERDMIERFHVLGHPLLNTMHVPVRRAA